jgi:hypothetical protein
MAKEEKIAKETKFEWKLSDDDGSYQTWYWDLSKSTHGPVRVEIQYSKEAITEFKDDKKAKRNKKKQKA